MPDPTASERHESPVLAGACCAERTQGGHPWQVIHICAWRSGHPLRERHACVCGHRWADEPAPERMPQDDKRATCEHAARQPRCKRDREGRCLMCCAHYHFRED
jgi:hypothetical protein